MMKFLGDAWARLLQTVMFWWVRVGDNPHHADLDRLRSANKLVYVLEHNSLADKLVLDRQTQKLDLPRALARMTEPGLEHMPHLCAVKEHQPLWGGKRDELSEDLERLWSYLEANPEEDLLLVPVALYWGRAADKNSNPLKELLSSNWSMVGRFIKFLTVLINGRNTYFEINDPLSLRALIDAQRRGDSGSESLEQHDAIKKLSRILRVHFRRVRAAVIGPDMSSKKLLVSKVMSSAAVTEAIARHAAAEGISEQQARKLAYKHINAIAADLSNTAVRFLSAVMSWVWNKIYSGIEMQGIEPVRELARDNALVFAPCHRSHIDYLLLSYQLYHNGLNVPHIVAGQNLDMPIVGRILRGCGAFFIRRSFGGDQLYTAVFNEYMHNLFCSGFSVEYFVEGGRSRTGRMLKPATGTLAMTLRSHLRSNAKVDGKPIVVVPVYIGYEKVFESSSYQGELRGKAKKKENLFDLAKTVNKLKNNGKVYLNFGDAIHLNEFLDLQRPDWRDSDYGPETKPEWLPGTVNQLAGLLAQRINAAAALNPINLVATALLATPHQAIDGRLLQQYLGFLRQLLVEVKSEGATSLISLPNTEPKDWLDYACAMDSLGHMPQKLGDLYGLDSRNAVSMSYYRNNVQHLFALPALVAALVAQGNGLSLSLLQLRVRETYPYVCNELFLSQDLEAAVADVERWLQFFQTHKLVEYRDHSWFAPERDQPARLQLELLMNVMMPALERYYIGLSVLVSFGSGSCTAAQLEEQSEAMAQRLSLLNGLDAPEFFDKSLFRRFIEALVQQEMISVSVDGLVEFPPELLRRLDYADNILPAEILCNVTQVANLSREAA